MLQYAFDNWVVWCFMLNFTALKQCNNNIILYMYLQVELLWHFFNSIKTNFVIVVAVKMTCMFMYKWCIGKNTVLLSLTPFRIWETSPTGYGLYTQVRSSTNVSKSNIEPVLHKRNWHSTRMSYWVMVSMKTLWY